ncbi:hypothetical protein [Peptoniphilus grossensis]|uniref:DUF4231 domain-containing protein n=1 Tax=Peptoniphilus grossensis TaxID=1465756 RepID=A0ABU7XBG2_9FIRM
MGIKFRKSIYNLSKPLTNSLEKATNEEVIEYINTKYLIRKDFTEDEVKNELIIFKYCRNDLDRDLKNREVFLNYFIYILAAASLIISIVALQDKKHDVKSISIAALILLVVSTIIILASTVKLFIYKTANGKLVALQYAIDVLEMKKEELESEKKN